MIAALTHPNMFEDLAPSSGCVPVLPALTGAEIAALLHSLDEGWRRAASVLDSSERSGTDLDTDVHDPPVAERRAMVRLAAIQGAYRRISDGTHNICANCGGPVGAARLAAIPETDRCVACARTNRPDTMPTSSS